VLDRIAVYLPVLNAIAVYLPVLNAIDAHICVRCIEWHLIDTPKALHTTCGAVVPHIMGGMPGLVSRLHLLAQQGMVTSNSR
jgi:hypothetical protein